MLSTISTGLLGILLVIGGGLVILLGVAGIILLIILIKSLLDLGDM